MEASAEMHTRMWSYRTNMLDCIKETGSTSEHKSIHYIVVNIMYFFLYIKFTKFNRKCI